MKNSSTLNSSARTVAVRLPAFSWRGGAAARFLAGVGMVGAALNAGMSAASAAPASVDALTFNTARTTTFRALTSGVSSGSVKKNSLAIPVGFASANGIPVPAANTVYTYTGGGTGSAGTPITGNFSNGFISTPGGAPASAATTQLNFGGSGATTYIAKDDITGALMLNNITLNSASTGTDTIQANTTAAGPNSLNFVSNGSATPDITQSGSGAFTLNIPLALTNNLTFDGIGTGNIGNNGIITGTGILTMSDPNNILSLNAPQTTNSNFSAGSTTTTVTVPSTYVLAVGAPVTGTNIPAGSYISAINSATTYTLTSPTVITTAGSNLTLTYYNAYSGGTTISGGTINVFSTGASGSGVSPLGSGTSTVSLTGATGNAVLSLTGSNEHINNPLNATSGGSGTMTLQYNDTGTASAANYDGQIVLGGGTLTILNMGTSGNVFNINGNLGPTPVSGTGTLALVNNGGTGNIQLKGVAATPITGTGTGIAITNTGTGGTVATPVFDILQASLGTGVTSVTQNSTTTGLSLTGTNTFTGAVNILAGTLKPGAAGTNANNVVTISPTGILDLAANNATIAGLNTGTGTGTAPSVTNSIAGVKVLTLGGNGTYSFGGVISGPVALTTAGTANQTLSGTNTYTGATTVAANTTLGLTGTLGSGGGTAITSAGTLNESNTGLITGTSTVAVTGGTTTLADANTYTGLTTISAGTLVGTNMQAFGNPTTNAANQISLGGGTLSLLNDGGTGTQTGQTIIYGGPTASAAGYNVTQTASSTVNVGNNGNAGSTNNTIQLGTLAIGNNTLTFTNSNNYNLAFGATTSTTSGSKFANNMTNGTLTLASLNDSGGSVTDTFNGTSATANTLVGAITQATGPFSITQSGVGTTTFTATNSNTGTDTVSAGTLALNAAGAVAGGAASNVLAVSGGLVTENATNAITGLSPVTITGGQVNLSQANNYTGATTDTNGILQLGNFNSLATSALTLNTGATLQLRNATAGTFNSATNGGNASTTLLGNGSTTTIDVGGVTGGGALGLTNLQAFSTSNATVNITNVTGDATTLALTNLTNNAGPITLNPTSTSVAIGNAAGTGGKGLTLGGTSTGNTIAGVTGNIGTLTKTGTSTFTITGASTNTSATAINGGILAVNNTTGSGTGSGAVTVGGNSATGTPILTGTGTISGAVTDAATGTGVAGTINPGSVGGVGTLHTGGAVTFGTGSNLTLDYGGNMVDELISTGNITTLSSAALSFNNIGGTALMLAQYTLVDAANAFTTANIPTSVTGLPSNYTLGIDTNGNLVLNMIPTVTNGQYTLAATTGVSNLRAGTTTTVTDTLTNTGTGNQDSLNYTGLADTANPSGSVGAVTPASGGPIAQGASATGTATYTAGSATGTTTITPSATVTNSTATGTPVGTINAASVNVYSGQESYVGATGGNYVNGSNATQQTQWSQGGAPGVDAGFTGQDSASITGGKSVVLNASPNLAALTLGGGSSLVAGGGTLTLDGTNASVSGGTNGTATVTATGTGNAISAPVTLATATTASVTSSGDTLTVSGSVTGTGSLTKTGAGTLTLTGTDSATGTTTVSAGTLALANGGGTAISNSAITVSSSGTVAVQASNQLGTAASPNGNSLPSVTLSGGTLADANGSSLGNSSNGAASGPNDGAGATASSFGAGTLTLSGGNSYLDFGAGNTGEVIAFSGFNSGTGNLYILNYNDGNFLGGFTPASGGGIDQLFFGGSGQTAQELMNVFFVNPTGAGGVTYNQTYEARLLSTGEVVAPEPSEWVSLLIGALGLSGLAMKARRRKASEEAAQAA